MHKIIKLFIQNKKITLREVAAAEPSRKTSFVLSEVLRRAYNDQQIVRKKAQALRNH